MGVTEGRIYSFFLLVTVSSFITEIVLALNWRNDLRAKASRSFEIPQPAVLLSQEAKHNLWSSLL